MSYASGQHIEDHLSVRLQQLGCDLTRSEELNHKYKLDFVITHFEGIAKMRPVGVQVTTRTGDRDKMREFLGRQRTFEYVEKALYVELHNSLIEQGVDKLVYSAILYFLFSSQFSGVACSGLRVRANFSIEFFDLDAEIARLAADSMPPVSLAPPQRPNAAAAAAAAAFEAAERASERGGEPAPGTTLRGYIAAINSRGYGFIHGDRVSHFFPFSKVEDAPLKETLSQMQKEARPWLKNLHIPVRFVTLGRVRGPGHDPQADRITRDEDAPRDEVPTAAATTAPPLSTAPNVDDIWADSEGDDRV